MLPAKLALLGIAIGAFFIAAPASADYFPLDLHDFTTADGIGSQARLTMDAAGNLYGTTDRGGGSGDGTIFELVKNGGGYTFQILHSFTGTDGGNPLAELLIDGAGNLYGTATTGGSNGGGVLFELVNSNGSFSFQTLHSFGAGSDGNMPVGGLIMDGAGDLYGTTYLGGLGAGTVFELVNDGGSFTEQILYQFTDANGDGAAADATLAMDGAGNLYGVTKLGGQSCGIDSSGCGTVFELVKSGNSYSEQVLYRFTGGADGALPLGNLLIDGAGDLFGSAQFGGTGDGTVFELVNGGGSFSAATLHSFTGADGDQPTGGLTMDGAGNLYGTADGGSSSDGVVFALIKANGYAARTLYNFTGTSSTGFGPAGGVVMDAAGNFYGVTDGAGGNGHGLVYELTLLPAQVPALGVWGMLLLGGLLGTAGLVLARCGMTGRAGAAYDARKQI